MTGPNCYAGFTVPMGEEKPLSVREGDLIHRRLDRLEENLETSRKEVRGNFQIVFDKIDSLGNRAQCEAHEVRAGAIEGRVDELEKSSRGLLSRTLGNAHIVLSGLALIVATIVAIWKLGG